MLCRSRCYHLGGLQASHCANSRPRQGARTSMADADAPIRCVRSRFISIPERQKSAVFMNAALSRPMSFLLCRTELDYLGELPLPVAALSWLDNCRIIATAR